MYLMVGTTNCLTKEDVHSLENGMRLSIIECISVIGSPSECTPNLASI
jgi:hypothetical protein